MRSDRLLVNVCSEVFEVGGYEWKLEMYPYGDSQSDKTLSVFLCAVDRKQLPGWSQTAHYQIAVVNKDPSKTSTHTGYDIFRGKRDSAVSAFQAPSTRRYICSRSISCIHTLLLSFPCYNAAVANVPCPGGSLCTICFTASDDHGCDRSGDGASS